MALPYHPIGNSRQFCTNLFSMRPLHWFLCCSRSGLFKQGVNLNEQPLEPFLFSSR